MKKKGKIITGCVIGAAVLAVGGIIYMKKQPAASEENMVYVESVGTMTGTGAGSANRFSGIVESQNTLKIAKDGDHTVKEILVSVGDEVHPGTVLFSYDTEELDLKIQEAELKLESIQNTIDMHKRQVEDLNKQKKNASKDEQLEYQISISEEELAQKQSEYEYQVQQMEVERLKKSMDTSEVTSTIDGIIQEINKEGGYDYNTGEEKPFMSIRAMGKYRVKGTISEQNIGEIYEGMTMVVHSRVDEELVWYGVIDTIDTQQTASNNNYYYGDSSEMASKYYFYISLDTSDGLMLGQHVYAEPDTGMGEEREGMWLMSDYVVVDDGDPYVWAANEKDRLEKRKVEISELDEETYQYQIISGLEPEDYIAWPDESLSEGAPVMKNDGSYGMDTMEVGE